MISISILPALWRIRITGLWKLPDGRDWLWGNLTLALMGRAMLSNSLVSFLLLGRADLRPNYVGVMAIMVTSFKTTYASCHSSLDCCIQCPRPCSRPLLTHVSARNPGHSQASLAQSLVGSLLLLPGSWCTQGFVCALRESVSPVLCKFCGSMVGLMVTSSKRAYAIPRSAAPIASAPAAGHC